jgi:hypothetical protein
MKFRELSDDEWKLIRPLLPPSGSFGNWLSVIKPALEGLYPSMDFAYYPISSANDVHDFLTKESGSVGFLVFQFLSPWVSRPIIQSGKPTVVITHTLYGSGEYLYEYSRDFKAKYYDNINEAEASKIAEAWIKGAEAIHTGTAEESEYDPSICATALKVKANARVIAGKFKWRAGWHRVLFYGNHIEEFRELATLLGLKTIIEDE